MSFSEVVHVFYLLSVFLNVCVFKWCNVPFISSHRVALSGCVKIAPTQTVSEPSADYEIQNWETLIRSDGKQSSVPASTVAQFSVMKAPCRGNAAAPNEKSVSQEWRRYSDQLLYIKDKCIQSWSYIYDCRCFPAPTHLIQMINQVVIRFRQMN